MILSSSHIHSAVGDSSDRSRGHCFTAAYNTCFNATHRAVTLLNGEIGQLRTVVLQNHIVLDILTAAQGGMCAVLHTECVYVFDA